MYNKKTSKLQTINQLPCFLHNKLQYDQVKGGFFFKPLSVYSPSRQLAGQAWWLNSKKFSLYVLNASTNKFSNSFKGLNYTATPFYKKKLISFNFLKLTWLIVFLTFLYFISSLVSFFLNHFQCKVKKLFLVNIPFSEFKITLKKCSTYVDQDSNLVKLKNNLNQKLGRLFFKWVSLDFVILGAVFSQNVMMAITIGRNIVTNLYEPLKSKDFILYKWFVDKLDNSIDKSYYWGLAISKRFGKVEEYKWRSSNLESRYHDIKRIIFREFWSVYKPFINYGDSLTPLRYYTIPERWVIKAVEWFNERRFIESGFLSIILSLEKLKNSYVCFFIILFEKIKSLGMQVNQSCQGFYLTPQPSRLFRPEYFIFQVKTLNSTLNINNLGSNLISFSQPEFFCNFKKPLKINPYLNIALTNFKTYSFLTLFQKKEFLTVGGFKFLPTKQKNFMGLEDYSVFLPFLKLQVKTHLQTYNTKQWLDLTPILSLLNSQKKTMNSSLFVWDEIYNLSSQQTNPNPLKVVDFNLTYNKVK